MSAVRPIRGALTALALVAASLSGCGPEGRGTADPDLRDLEADQVMTGVEHFLTEDGVRRAHLKADTVLMLEEGATAHVRHYTIDFFDKQGKRRSVLSAVDGIYDMESGDMRATGDVVVVDPDESQRLQTERLVYDASEDRLNSDVEFTLVRGRDTIRGTGFDTDPGLDSLTSRRPSLISPPEEGAGAGVDRPGRRPPPDTAAPDTASGDGPSEPPAETDTTTVADSVSPPPDSAPDG